MNASDIIRKKRDGRPLTKEEIEFMINGCVDGSIPDYQISALLMAIYLKDMNYEETEALTFAIRDSGVHFSYPAVEGCIVDKHSTGGVGDGTSLVVAPIVAACGGNVSMVVGRGLGFTGGTLDKLESITGFKTQLDDKEAEFDLKKNGLVIMGQSEKMAPADKKLYALRDVTATVEKIPLIASSIMGKKLAEGSDALILDVKMGSGAFMKNFSEAQMLASTLYRLAQSAGIKCCVLVTNMEEPLGEAIGNAMEVKQAIETMKGKGPEDFTELCLILASYMLAISGKGTVEDCRKMAEKSIKNGSALKKFRAMVAAQGGDVAFVDKPERIPQAKYFFRVASDETGVVIHQDAQKYGEVSCMLGAGRTKVTDAINPYAGILLKKKCGDTVVKGDTIALLYSDDPDIFREAKHKILEATTIGDKIPEKKPLLLKKYGDVEA